MIYTVTLNPAVDRELSVPAIEFDSVLRATAWRVDFGGKGFNVSRMLMSLGTPNMALGFAGGRSGELLRDGLEDLGIKTEFVWVEGETRTNVSIVSQADGRYVKANEPGPAIAPADCQALEDKIRSLVQPDDWWVLAGSLPPGVPVTYYVNLIQVIKEAGGYAVLDTSGEALAAGCTAGPHLVKPNELEAHTLTGMPIDSLEEVSAAAAEIQRKGIAIVVISLGKDGALLTDGDETWIASSPAIIERNPIGAGDSLVGGLVWSLHQLHAPAESLRWGVACGAGTASTSGTGVGTRELVESLHPQVVTRKLVQPD